MIGPITSPSTTSMFSMSQYYRIPAWKSTLKSECGELFSCAWKCIILHWIPDTLENKNPGMFASCRGQYSESRVTHPNRAQTLRGFPSCILIVYIIISTVKCFCAIIYGLYFGHVRLLYRRFPRSGENCLLRSRNPAGPMETVISPDRRVQNPIKAGTTHPIWSRTPRDRVSRGARRINSTRPQVGPLKHIS